MSSNDATPELTQIAANSSNHEFNQIKLNCTGSKKLLACYFEHNKEEEEKKDGAIRSKSKDEKELTCSIEDYQQFLPILMENTYEKLCKCLICYKMYQNHNVEFLFLIKNIEWLPTEVLLKIFKQLTPSDRRVVSECCKRFLEIWLCDDFNDDRHRLVFDCCVLDPERKPLSVFMKSSRIYRTLVFGEIKMSGESVFAGNYWENITTIELIRDLEPSDERVNKKLSLLSQFPNLKTVKVGNIGQLGDFSNLPNTIELLVISIPRVEIFGKELNLLMRYLDRKSDSFRAELKYDISTKNILNFTASQRNKIQRVTLCFGDVDETFKLPRFDNLKYLELYFRNSCYFGTEEILDNLEGQCPALKDLSINIRNRLPHKNWTCLKELYVRSIPKEEMSRISIFENLKELTLEPNRKCFFFHETLLNKNLKELTIDFDNEESCFTCFQTITKSFPNLENLSCYFFVTNNHLEELAANTPKLKCLNLARVYTPVSFACLPNLTELKISNHDEVHDIEPLPLMLRLRKLDFSLSCLNFESVKIFERMPALEDLTMFCPHIERDQIALFDAVTKPLKRLRKFFFHYDSIEPEDPGTFDAIANNCKYLQRLSFFAFEQHEWAIAREAREEFLKLLQKHSSLRFVNGVWLK